MVRGKSKTLRKRKNRGRGRPRKILLAPSDGTVNTPAATNAISELDETPSATPIGISPAEVSSSHVPTRSSYGKDLKASRPEKGQHVNSNGIVPDLQESMEIAEEKGTYVERNTCRNRLYPGRDLSPLRRSNGDLRNQYNISL
ncbi:hypothetical protein HAX54_003217 [Datura stramonium]|uniref:Uncharacterized protein n=1 Tax=Datura stramonium TaxID=4076 RepID=A0ABS8T5R4_DATST|nr:hypothetical protein [Datura stramonium]